MNIGGLLSSKIDKLTFACLARPGRSALEAVMLTASLREFGGHYADSPVWIFTPDSETCWKESEISALTELGVQIESYPVPSKIKDFPFGPKVLAAEAAEKKAREGSRLLVWMDSDSLIISEPLGLILSEGQKIGCRPVDHTLIGSEWEKPVDPFWTRVFQDCGVGEDRIFSVRTSVDEKMIRAYLNAGFLVIRPELGFLAAWARAFQEMFARPEYQDFYEEHILYRIFFHQAVLAGVMLASFSADKYSWLPPFVNYPLHMHVDYPPDIKPDRLEDFNHCPV